MNPSLSISDPGTACDHRLAAVRPFREKRNGGLTFMEAAKSFDVDFWKEE